MLPANDQPQFLSLELLAGRGLLAPTTHGSANVLLLSKCDKGFGLCIGPLPVYFCGHYSFGPCTSQLINLICNMLGNMLNDLAEAIRRWTEKNGSANVLKLASKQLLTYVGYNHRAKW